MLLTSYLSEHDGLTKSIIDTVICHALLRGDNICLKPQPGANSTVPVFLWKSGVRRLCCLLDRAWHARCLSSIEERPHERTGQPPVLEHEDQDRDLDAGDLRGALLIGGRTGGGAASLRADAEDLKSVRKGLESVFLANLIP